MHPEISSQIRTWINRPTICAARPSISTAPPAKYLLRRLGLGLWLCACLILTAASSAQEVDPKPPQVSVDFYYPPGPLIQHGTPRLVYEMLLSEYPPTSYELDSIDVSAGARTFSFSGAKLQSMMRLLGEKKPSTTSRHLGEGQSAVVYFMLEFAKTDEVPDTLGHTLHLTSADGGHHALVARPLQVSKRAPVVIAPPLRGDGWLAGDSVHNGVDAAHRRTILLAGGQRGWPNATRLIGYAIASSTESRLRGPGAKIRTVAIFAMTTRSTAWRTARSWKRWTDFRKTFRIQEGMRWTSTLSTPEAITSWRI